MIGERAREPRPAGDARPRRAQHLERFATAPKALPAAARNAVFRSMLKNGLLARCAAPRE